MTEEEKKKEFKINTMDDPEYWKIPPAEYKMSEEMKEKNERLSY